MKSLLPFGLPTPIVGAGHCLGALAILVASFTLAAPAAGQIVIGGNASPRQAVVVDLGAVTGLAGPGTAPPIPGLFYGPIPPPVPDFVPPPELYLPLAVAPPTRPATPPGLGVPAPLAPAPVVTTPDAPASGVPAPEIHLPLSPAQAPPAAAAPTPVLPGPGQPVTGAPPPVPATPPAPPPVEPDLASAPAPRPVQPDADAVAGQQPAVIAQAAPDLSVPALTPDVPAPPQPVRRPAPVTPLPTPTAPPPATVPTPSPPPAAPDLGDLTPPDQPGILQERPPAPATDAAEPRIQTVDPAATDVAALDPAVTVEALDELSFRIRFPADSSDPGAAAEPLLSSLVERMAGSGDVRLEIKAYAGTGSGTPGDARRLSLRRALAIRTFLVERGIESTRIDVKALGDTAPDSPSDRVDLFLSG